jgi:hypothetical protein
MTDTPEQVSMTPGQSTEDVSDILEKLLYGQQQAAPAEEAEEASPEPQPKPTPVQEPDDDEAEDGPAVEPSAEVEGDVLQTSEPDKAVVAAPEAKPSVPEAPKTQPEADKTQETLLAQLNTLVPQLQAAIAGEFGDIQSHADLLKIAQEDPQRYNRFVIYQAQLSNAQAKQNELRTDFQRRWYASEAEKLSKALPDIVDPKKGPALKAELRTFALAQGYTEQQIQMASAHDVLTLHKAMQFDNWQKAQAAEKAKIAAEQQKAKAKAANAPPVSKPGVAQDEKRDKAQERLQQFQKSGKPEDLAALLQAAGIA